MKSLSLLFFLIAILIVNENLSCSEDITTTIDRLISETMKECKSIKEETTQGHALCELAKAEANPSKTVRLRY